MKEHAEKPAGKPDRPEIPHVSIPEVPRPENAPQEFPTRTQSAELELPPKAQPEAKNELHMIHNFHRFN